MLKIDMEPIALKLLNNKTAHSDYLKHTQEQAAILREVVEQGKSQNPLNNSLDSAYKYTKRIQELLIIIRQTCPSINNSGDKLVSVTPNNKDKRVRITTTTEVPPKKPTTIETNTPMPVVTLVYSKKPRKSKSNDLVNKSKIIKSISANNKEPSKSYGSIVSDVPSSSLDECKLENIIGYSDYQIGNVTISRVYYVQGLGHNLFSVGQPNEFVDQDNLNHVYKLKKALYRLKQAPRAKKNDVKARTTLLLSLPDEHQLRFSKYKTAKELLAAILKTFGGNKATKKRKKNLLKKQYGNFKAEGSETLEQTFNRLQVIVSQLQFMDVEVEKDDLNQKFLTSLAPEWMMHTINMAFISSSKNNSGNEDGNIACVSTSSVNVTPISQDTASAYIASQSNGSQIKFEDINQIDEGDMEEIDIKWSMALLSMRADKF
nr:hypothetical protein [Tanacetum cinerariifolium]